LYSTDAVDLQDSVIHLSVPIFSTGRNRPVVVTIGFIQMEAIAIPMADNPTKLAPTALKDIVCKIAGFKLCVVQGGPLLDILSPIL